MYSMIVTKFVLHSMKFLITKIDGELQYMKIRKMGDLTFWGLFDLVNGPFWPSRITESIARVLMDVHEFFWQLDVETETTWTMHTEINKMGGLATMWLI